jgi:tetratricopeptide (TPR) repeat protein/tRNA A-37 threonylcarbamoyl transferase component Bud32
MNPERWHRVTEIFHAAVEQQPSQKDQFLRDACGDDAELYAEVRHMLQEHARSGLLDRPPLLTEPAAGSPVFSTGQTVSGRYRIVRFLSCGGMGEVYEADDLELKERVALKTLLPAIADDMRMIARFKQEIQLSRKISHPNVCRVFDLARHPVDGSSPETTFFLTMEFLSGETLAARLGREPRMATAAALPLMEQMAAALEAAHRCGIIHRDLKPSNVMLAPDGAGVRAVVTDFGLARSFGPSPRETTATATGNVMGTLDYMAPELLTGSAASVASDIYALGMVAYRMVAGALPFPSDTPLAGAILRSRVPVPSPKSLARDLDPKWERAILRALDPEPARRFGRASEFVRALRGEAAVTVSLPVMTRRRWIAATLAVLAVVGGWAGWREWRHARNQPSPEAAMLYQKGVDDIHAGAYFAATKALAEAVRVAPHFGLAHARLAEAWAGLDVSDKASQEMLVALGEDISGLSKFDGLQIEAVRRTVTKKFTAAVETYRQMHEIAPQDSDVDLDLGRACENASLPEEAVACYRRVAEGLAHNAAAWLRLAVLYDRRSDATNSEAAFRQAEQQYELTSNLEGRTEVAYRQGVAARRRGQSDEAVRLLGKALEMAHLSGNAHQEIRAKLDLSNYYYESGETEHAEQYAREALDTARTNQMEYFAIGGIVQLGNAYRAKMDFQGAETLFKQALELARRTNAQRMVAVNQLSLASLYSRLSRSQETVREAREALTFYQPNGFGLESRQCLLLLGRGQRDLGDLPGARESFQNLLQMAEKAVDRGSLAAAHEAMGSLQAAYENYPEALNEYQKNLDYCSDVRGRNSAHRLLGSTLWVLGNYGAAHKMFDSAEAEAASFPSLGLDLAQARAEMALSEARYADAAAISRRALAAAAHEPPLAAALEGILGQAQLALGDKREGIRNCEESLRAIEKQENVARLLRARLMLAEARLDAGDVAGAMNLLQEVGPALATRPESRWRAVALKARVDPQAIAPALQALDEVRHFWGDNVFERYRSRPDIQKLSRPLLRAISAKQ